MKRNNPFPYSDDNKRYHTLSYHNRRCGIVSQKAVIDAGFSCPNKDGRCGTEGCIFCSDGSGYFTASPALPVCEQLDREISRIRNGKRHSDSRVIAYFQANTNTYAPLSHLRDLYEDALRHEDVCGLAIATRPDCLPLDVLDYLEQLAGKTNLTVELGLQTIHDETAVRINRGYQYTEFEQSYSGLKRRGIRVCVHLIDGLPGENTDSMEASARTVGQLKPDAVKLHLLHVVEGTELARMYRSGSYTPLSSDEYIDIVIRQLELLPPETVIERITGDGDRRTLIAPLWSLDKIYVLGTIDRMMIERDTWQGKHYRANCPLSHR